MSKMILKKRYNLGESEKLDIITCPICVPAVSFSNLPRERIIPLWRSYTFLLNYFKHCFAHKKF